MKKEIPVPHVGRPSVLIACLLVVNLPLLGFRTYITKDTGIRHLEPLERRVLPDT